MKKKRSYLFSPRVVAKVRPPLLLRVALHIFNCAVRVYSIVGLGRNSKGVSRWLLFITEKKHLVASWVKTFHFLLQTNISCFPHTPSRWSLDSLLLLLVTTSKRGQLAAPPDVGMPWLHSTAATSS